MLASETWERKNKRLKDIIATNQYQVLSYHREGSRVGGGCAIVYSQARFNVESIDVDIEPGVEGVWALLTPKVSSSLDRVKRIAVGSFYVSPNSPHKQATIDHIIHNIQIIRSMYNNEVNFILGGDFNRLNINSILDSYGALKQSITVPTRQDAILEIILSDISTLYHPPTTLPPLQVDHDQKGADSDHNIIILAPLSNASFKLPRIKKVVKTRPLPESQIYKGPVSGFVGHIPLPLLESRINRNH